MIYAKLNRKDFASFFESLRKYGKIYGPVKISESYGFKEVSNVDELSLDYPRTMIPPKKFFIKPQERIFEFNEEKAEYLEIIEEERVVVFGVHPCDINAIKLLDKVYINDMPDKYYQKRRENTIIIGISCHPDEYCFCKSVGTSYAVDGFDLFLHEISDGYLIRAATEKGYELIAINKDSIKDVEASDIDEFKEREQKRLTEFKLDLNPFGLQDMLELAHDHAVWKEYADKCFGCGTCNLVCPTCRCYDVTDLMKLDLKTGERARRWDSCMLRKHGLVAGGLNFRPTRVERLRNRFNCKGSLREGMINCVGCGRCTVYCPASIRYVEVLQKVRGEIK